MIVTMSPRHSTASDEIINSENYRLAFRSCFHDVVHRGSSQRLARSFRLLREVRNRINQRAIDRALPCPRFPCMLHRVILGYRQLDWMCIKYGQRPTSRSSTSPDVQETSALVSLIIRTADSRYFSGIKESSPYYLTISYTVTTAVLLLTHECRGLILSLACSMRRVQRVIIHSVEEAGDNVIEESRFSRPRMVSNCCAFGKSFEPEYTNGHDKPGRTCQTLRSPRGFSSDWLSHSQVAVGKRWISFSTLALAVSVSSESSTCSPYDCLTVVPGEVVWSLDPFG
jgi:hypothetical protein